MHQLVSPVNNYVDFNFLNSVFFSISVNSNIMFNFHNNVSVSHVNCNANFNFHNSILFGILWCLVDFKFFSCYYSYIVSYVLKF